MKKIIVGCLALFLTFTFMSCGKQNEEVKENLIVKTEFEILKEEEVKDVENKDLYLEYDYEVKSVEIKGTTLEVVIESNVNTSDGIYALGKFISGYIKEENKAKFDLYGVDSESIVFINKNKKWLYDGSNTIKSIK
ncbi:hypothetical protein [uncultured Clostridium sp.]|uniref:hypothetical protein n=1 Tax=uncultured Clostridium sp. TaxID=59620 RepID=UPI0026398D6F|nr:hypothetical protein [uncultured Clostridium sp.]